MPGSGEGKANGESDAMERKLRDEIELLKRKLIATAELSREDRLKLAILDQSPFTIWAADRECKIRLWSPSAARVYGRSSSDAIGKDFVKLFVDPVEAADARKDCRRIVDDNAVFSNFLAFDHTAEGQRTMLTNCFRVQDPTTGEFLQAEVGLDISDLPEREKKHRNLRELARELAAKDRMLLDLARENARHDLERQYVLRVTPVNMEINELESYFEKADEKYGREHASRIRQNESPKLRTLKGKREAIDQEREAIAAAISRLDAVDDIAPLRDRIKEFGNGK